MHKTKQITAAIIGVASTLIGILLHLFAINIAWPKEYSYTGERENTVWAIMEAAYQNIGLIFLIFGLAILLVTMINWLWTTSTLHEH